MQYPKPESQTLNLLKAAFECANEILVLCKGDGTVIEINRRAEEGSNPFVKGSPLWQQAFWASEIDRHRCHHAYESMIHGRDIDFMAAVKSGRGLYNFSLKVLSGGPNGEHYFLMTGPLVFAQR